MTRLLVSVRDVEEARIALEAGVDLIDLKEPTRGALGAVDFQTAAEIVRLRDESHGERRHVPLSMALGELADALPNVPEGIAFVKVGLAGCRTRTEWPAQLRTWRRSLPAGVDFVAVAYADADATAAPETDEIVAEAISLEARAVLVDTGVKDGRTLLDHWNVERLRRFVVEVQARGMLAVVGGGLTLETIRTVVDCGADYVAVRGAACQGGRTAKIAADRIRAIRALLPQLTVRR
ncbi:MAG: (5-formylfuran-3-yl)methyl phosphate synthase [Planctomycetia bacterium]|nr:(5-formylfuran-3-yl)methyl phosphate synthase [Planctomycetia bacterium]